MNRKIFRAALALLFLSLLLSAPAAQQTAATKPSPNDRVPLYQALLDLTNPWTVMCIAAHPDDEDGTSLIVMRRKYGAHTVSLFSTFGEGGQNAIGPELYEEMGAIRVRETRAAAEIQGSEPYFLGLKDYGFSKTADEAFKIWNHEEALRRMVLQIRKLRPDVIITNHSVTNNDHGQHQATARLTVEAFDAAADPARFPEQLKDGVTVWQVQRLFVRAGRSSTPAPTDTRPLVTIDPNERDPVRDTTFAEEALRALHQHATQGPWPKTVAELASRFRMSTDGKLPLTRYALVREAKGAEALSKDSHNFLDGLKLPESFTSELEAPSIDGKPLVEFANDRPAVLAELLKYVRKGFRFTRDWSNAHRLGFMKERIVRATAVAAGFKVEVEPPNNLATPNSNIDFKVRISNSGAEKLYLFGCRSGIPSLNEPVDSSKVAGGPTSIFTSWEELNGGAAVNKKTELLVPEKAPINVPLASHLYDPMGLGLQVITHCAVGVGVGSADQFALDEITNLDVASPVEITSLSPSPAVRTPPDRKPKLRGTMDCVLRDFDFKVRLTNHLNSPFSGQLIVGPGFGRKAANHPITIGANGQTDLTVSVPGCPQEIEAKTRSGNTGAPISFTVLGGAVTKPLTRLEVPIVFADAQVAPNLSVGYVRGFDFSLPNALAALGVESKELSVDEVKTADLSKYSSVIVDNRVYESTPGLIEANQRLLDYAKAGGTLIVFYHKSFEWNPDPKRNRPQLAPYKLILGDERITDENAPISFLEPQHPLLNTPNKLGQEDFANWIQERGLYYPKEWDPQFHALLQSNDPGEAPLKGGLLVADYGSGRYIYTSMVWYRELRAGVPGAYRMLANMISYGHSR